MWDEREDQLMTETVPRMRESERDDDSSKRSDCHACLFVKQVTAALVLRAGTSAAEEEV